MYLPLRYTIGAKYPRFYVIDQIALVDMLMPIVATSYDLRSLVLHMVIIPIFVMAFMCVYEIGYFENDMQAAKMEAAPSLSDDVKRFLNYRVEPHAWIWALALTAAGTGLVILAGLFSPKEMLVKDGLWIMALVAVRAVFYGYNRQDVARRPLGYVALQILKYGSVLLIFRPTIFGAAIIAGQISMMSVIYWVYRLGGRQRTANKEIMRLALVCALGAPLLMTGARTGLDTVFSGFLAAAWLVLRLAKPPIMAALSRRRGEYVNA